nr:MAG: putative replicase protein [Leviviridae sp.]
MKSLAGFLKGLYGALIEDIIQANPRITGLRRDLNRLESILDRNSLSFFMIDLPAFSKHFDKCLAEGRLTLSHLPHMRARKKASQIPRLFGGLIERVFQENGELRSNPDIDSIAFIRQLCNVAKKVRQDCGHSRKADAIREWFGIEEEIRNPSSDWNSDEVLFSTDVELHDCCLQDPQPVLFQDWNPGITPDCRSLMDCIQRVADVVTSEFGLVEYDDLSPKAGPGAVSEQTWNKYKFQYWPRKLERVFPFDGFGLPSPDPTMWYTPSCGEPPARLLAVPKTLKGPRLVAAEPLAHQWCQQALHGFLRKKISEGVLRFSIDLRDQSKNRDIAHASSLLGTHSTIDLSSASDRLSCWLVERLFRKNQPLLYAFHAVRTRWIVQKQDKRLPKHLMLKKFSTQGSALTFPVQSICFAILAIGSVLHSSGRTVNARSVAWAAKQVRIYGDDIVVPVGRPTEAMLSSLGAVGLKVNHDKTFTKGNFRESCGIDAFNGYDVTPTYVLEDYSESRPSSVTSVIDTSNNALRAGYWRLADYLWSRIPERIQKSIPVEDIRSGSFGIKSFAGRSHAHLRGRWNKALQRTEVRMLGLRSKQPVTATEGASPLLQYFTEAPDPFRNCENWSSGSRGRATSTLTRRWVPLYAG